MTSRPWTPSEDQYLRGHYETDGAHACAVALGRSFASLTHHTRRLGLIRQPRWTWRHDLQLRALWGVHPIEVVASTMRRSVHSVYWRAGRLGLGRGCPQGFESLSSSATRTGYAVCQLRRILNWARVSIDRASTISGRVRPEPKRRHWVVEPSAVDDAIARWHLTEQLEAAARRHGVCSSVILRLFREAEECGDDRVPARPRRKRHWRVPSALVDELMAADRERRGETLDAAAERVGVSPGTLGKWLRSEGVAYSKKDGVPSDEVDRVVAAKRTLVTCRAWCGTGRRAA